MLKGKTALVTGSTSGIGLAIARAFAKEGANLMINGFGDKDAIEKERAGLEKEFGIKVLYSPADMSKPAEIVAMVQETEKAFGSLDVLVNNAGIQHVANIEDFPPEKWDAIIAINLSSSFHTVRAAMPGMKKRKWGRIINIASAHGLVASGQKVAYVAAKHGIVGLTKTVAIEAANDGVTCNAICPGWVLTPLVQKQIDDRAKASGKPVREEEIKLLSEKQPMHEFSKPENIGALAVFPGERRRRQHDGLRLFDRRRLGRAVVIDFLTRAFGDRSGKPRRPRPEGPGGKKMINLALQGGGAHGAFTWGVLDYLLEDGRLNVEGISGTSAGAVNAVMLADGLKRGGPDEARKRLADFWQAASLGGELPAVQRAVMNRLFSLLPSEGSPTFDWLNAWSRYLSPYDLNPLNINPLKDLIERFVDFEGLRADTRQLFIAATNVQTGKLHIFPKEKISAEAVMASACLPAVFRAVEIDGVPYWDGGYLGNPVLFPFFRATDTEGRADRSNQSGDAQESAALDARHHGPRQRDHLQFGADGGVARHRVRQPADRPKTAAARHRRSRIPADQGAPHRTGRPRRALRRRQQAAQRLQVLRAPAQARRARGAALPRQPLRRHRRAFERGPQDRGRVGAGVI